MKQIKVLMKISFIVICATLTLISVTHANLLTPWQILEPLPGYANGEHVTIAGGYIYAFGTNGSQREMWYAQLQSDGAIGTWWTTTTPIESHNSRGGFVGTEDAIYFIGGHGGGSSPTSTVEFANINPDGSLSPWSTTSQLNTPRSDPAVAIAGNYMYVAGGWSSNWTFLNSVEYAEINPDGSLGPWQLTSSMQHQRPNAAIAAINGYLYAFGGARHNYITNTVERAPINADGSIETWVFDESLPEGRGGHGIAVIWDTVFIVGGHGGTYGHNELKSVVTAAIQQDLTLSPWKQTEPLVTANLCVTSMTLGSRIYATGLQDQLIQITVSNLPSVRADVDVNPDILNLKSKDDWITVYIELPEGYSVEDTDINSIILSELSGNLLDPPLYTTGAWEIGDYNQNNISDLMVKFDRQAVEEKVNIGAIEVTICGLIDGYAFKGTDVIFVIYKCE